MPAETSNNLATLRAPGRIARDACMVANQADADCIALAAKLEETRAELERVRKERDAALDTIALIRAVLA